LLAASPSIVNARTLEEIQALRARIEDENVYLRRRSPRLSRWGTSSVRVPVYRRSYAKSIWWPRRRRQCSWPERAAPGRNSSHERSM